MGGKKRSYCLPSQEILDFIASGKLIAPGFSPDNIQPSSYDLRIGDVAYILDHEEQGIIGPRSDTTVYRSLLELPRRSRVQVRTDGFQVKAGYTYLLPLEERLHLVDGEYARSSPKSSGGRNFFKTRLLGDCNPAFDEVHGHYSQDETMLWLLLQPLVFDAIIHPGLSLNQLRIFNGYNAQVDSYDLKKFTQRNPILYDLNDNGELSPAKHEFTSKGLLLHLDLKGRETEGIVGLRARKNTIEPIDLAKKRYLHALDYFEPIKAQSHLQIKPDEHYLFASREVIQHPAHLNSELNDYASVGFTGPTHFAGFIDNRFIGDLVFEIATDEIGPKLLTDGMPISNLTFFRTGKTSKVYGDSIGSHYQGQKGPKPAKYFSDIDYSFAGRNHKKLLPNVLVQDARVLQELRKATIGYEPLSVDQAKMLMSIISQGFFHSRFDCEDDESLLQPIPYVIIFQDDKVFSYVRASNIKDYGDKRLFGKHSIGVGGHIHKEDGPDYLRGGLERELREELLIEGLVAPPLLKGTLMQFDTPVDKVHFGLIYAVHTKGLVKPHESSIVSGEFKSIDDILHDKDAVQKYETWSRVLIPELPQLYKA